MKGLMLIIFLGIITKGNATDLQRPSYKIEFDTKTEKIKILSKTKSSKACDEEVRKKETIEFLKRTIKRNEKTKTRKVYMTYRCYL